MKNKNFHFATICLSIFCLSANFSTAQNTPTDTLPPNPNLAAFFQKINADIWLPFSESYAENSVEKYAALHSADFIRVSGGANSSISNLENYIAQSRVHFGNNQTEGRKIRIEFRFLERIANDSTASERGIYHYISEDKVGKIWDGYGKFHVIERIENGQWKILVDYDSDENKTIGQDDWDAAFGLEYWGILPKSRG